MKINTNQDIYLYEKRIIFQETIRGWSIVIMPDNILIDNYEHGFPHIHPDRAMIKTKTLYETLFIVKAHIEKYKKVELDLLREELLK
ncbi:hypothetical protein [Methanosphaera sp.]|uniref:hypothetical protein n=1 Tax=Methanosphaera sp. TaxID=2666342 RepID=UPI002E774643|nr:hypothetical protein [Methanosphaera sp.]MEE1117804.1 hypothetical protein [Methanosphaera sp.]